MIKIIIDSACDDDRLDFGPVQVEKAPLIIDIDGKTYVDDNDLDMENYISAMSRMSYFNTSCPAPHTFEELYGGDGDVLVLTISSKLSGSYQSAVLARRSYFEKHGKKKKIHVFDSQSASGGQANILVKMVDLVSSGMHFDGIISDITEFIKHSKAFFVLQNLNNLAKAGRVSSLIATASSALNIRCLMGSEEGSIVLLQKTIGERKCFKMLAKKVEQFSQSLMNKTLCISHCEAMEKVELFLEELSRLTDTNKFKEIIIQKTNGLASLYAGIGGIVVGLAG